MAEPQVPVDIQNYLAQENGRIHDELFEFLRMPSVSAESKYAQDVRTTALWLMSAMQKIGLAARLEETSGHPIVIGEWRKAPGAPTVLVYGHYDVQPPDPLDLWESPPFEPTMRDGKIFARGSVDDKGQLFAHLKALEAHLKVRGSLPVNVIVLAEGEEEVGSPNLAAFIEAHAKELACEAVVISDSGMFAEGAPSIGSSLRGLAYFQIDVEGPATDLHSGSYGGAVVNPATALARILATLHDKEGRVAVPGFYDDVLSWPEEVKSQMRGLPFNEEQFRKEIGAAALGGEKEFSVLERLWTRPTCEINGLLSGYTGEGAKTVLPAKAMAKVSFRLVPGQDPKKVEQLFRTHLVAVAPEGVKVSVMTFHGGSAWRADINGPLFAAARRALTAAFGKEPVLTGEGGSIPVVSDFERVLKVPVLLVGFGLPGENAHAPNEWILDENFTKGMQTLATLWDEYALQKAG